MPFNPTKYYRERYQNDKAFRELRKISIKKSQQKYPFRTWAQHTLKSHKRKRIEIILTRMQIEKMAEKIATCPLCNCMLIYNKSFSDCSASLDRIDNAKGLSIDNTQILCYRCNNAKRTMNMIEFKIWITKVYFKLQ